MTGIFEEPEDGFWHGIDRDQFEIANRQSEWPQSGNPFLMRWAQNLKPGSGQLCQQLSLDEVAGFIGGLVRARPNRNFVLRMRVMARCPLSFSVELDECLGCSHEPPIFSSNACALPVALDWMANRANDFQIACAADATFWIPKS